MTDIKRETVLGFPTDVISAEDAEVFIIKKMSAGELLHVITVNPEMTELASKNAEFASVLNSAGLIVPDGAGVRLALKLRGIKQNPVTGIDLAKKTLEKCAEYGFKVAFIGAKEEVVKKASENIKNEITGLDIAYIRNGYFGIEEENRIIEELKESGAKLVLVALGAPKQEFFIKKCTETIKNAVFIGVGGSFDVWAGNVKRAPKIFRMFGCEWLYRTLTQPQRIKRIYKTLPLFFVKIIIESVKLKFNKD